MAQVSKYLVSDKIQQEIKSIFSETISLLSNKDEIVSFLEDFLSPTERIVLSKRITIALMLKKGYSYEMIKKLIKVSQPTVAAVNLKLKYSGKGYHRVLDKMIANQKINHIFNQIENFILNTLSRGKGKGSGVWQEIRKKHQQATSSII